MGLVHCTWFWWSLASVAWVVVAELAVKRFRLDRPQRREAAESGTPSDKRRTVFGRDRP